MAKAGRLHIQLDVNYHEDAAIASLDVWAELFYIRLLCFAKKHLTDGIVTENQLKLIGKAMEMHGNRLRNVIETLLKASLITSENENFSITAWLGWNKSTDEVLDIIAARREFGRRGGVKSGESRRIKANVESKPICFDKTNPETETETETETYKNLSDSTKSKSRERKRDEVFETLVEVCGCDLKNLSRTERGRLNSARQELKELGVCPDDVRTRAAEYRSKWPGIDLTPQALTGNWSKLSGIEKPKPYSERPELWGAGRLDDDPDFDELAFYGEPAVFIHD